MAHFAQLAESNIVIQVIVVSNADLLDENGVEQEALGIQVCRNIFGAETNWVQTSYNHRFRKQYAQPGHKYDEAHDLFYNPVGPFPSWTLDENYDWQPPAVRPTDGKDYWWDEATLAWIEVTSPEE